MKSYPSVKYTPRLGECEIEEFSILFFDNVTFHSVLNKNGFLRQKNCKIICRSTRITYIGLCKCLTSILDSSVPPTPYVSFNCIAFDVNYSRKVFSFISKRTEKGRKQHNQWRADDVMIIGRSHAGAVIFRRFLHFSA